MLGEGPAINIFKRTVKVFSNVTSCWNINDYRRFESLYSFYLQGQPVFGLWKFLDCPEVCGLSSFLGMSRSLWSVKHSLDCQAVFGLSKFLDCPEVCGLSSILWTVQLSWNVKKSLVCQAFFRLSSSLWGVKHSLDSPLFLDCQEVFGLSDILWGVKQSLDCQEFSLKLTLPVDTA